MLRQNMKYFRNKRTKLYKEYIGEIRELSVTWETATECSRDIKYIGLDRYEKHCKTAC